MTRSLPFPFKSIGTNIDLVYADFKEFCEGENSLNGKEILSEEEVESPHIPGLGSAAFSGSSSFEKNDATKSIEGDESSGRKQIEG